MVHIHSVIRILFIASLTVFTTGVSVTRSHSKRTIERVKNDIIDINKKLTTFSGSVQAAYLEDPPTFSSALVSIIHQVHDFSHTDACMRIRSFMTKLRIWHVQ